jgi:hypothetical protein
MTSAIASSYFADKVFLKSYDHDPGATTAVLAGPDGGTTIQYLDMKDYLRFAAMARPTIIAAGGLTKLEIVASADVAFTTPVVIKDSGVVAADSLNDVVFLECHADEVVQAGATLRYVAARLTMATNTDEANVTYLAEPRFQNAGITATVIT